MTRCLKCKAEHAEQHFRVLEVQTLHIRDLNGERRVQALGRFQDWSICDRCASARVDAAQAPGRRLWKKCFPFGLVLLAGILLTALLRSEILILNLLGPAAIFCGLAGGISVFRRDRLKTRPCASFPERRRSAARHGSVCWRPPRKRTEKTT